MYIYGSNTAIPMHFGYEGNQFGPTSSVPNANDANSDDHKTI